MKKMIFVTMLLAGVTVFTGCSDVVDQEAAYTEQLKQQSLDTVGLAEITQFTEMGYLKEIYELKDNPDLTMYWYTRNENPALVGQWVYEGQCMGYGIPFGASLTSPEVYEYNGATVPQAEPNGIYTNGVTSSATWIIAVDSEGELSPEYVEQEIRVTQNKIDARLCVQEYLPEGY